MKKYILLALGLLGFAAIGQDKLEIIDLDEINQSIELKAQEEDYEGILEELEKINKNDTAYPYSLIRSSYYLMVLERNEDALEVLNKGFDLDIGDVKSSFYQNKAVVLNRLERFDECLDLLEEGLGIFPANHILMYHKSTALEGKGDLKEAVKVLEKLITVRPFYANSYIKLGAIYFGQERTAQALMAFNLALMVDPDGESAFARLSAVNTMFSTDNDNKRTPGLTLSEDDKAFSDIDLLISNRIALNDNYEIDSDLDFALTKQNHALLLKLKDFKGNGGFWSEKIVPFFLWINETENFEVYTYTISYSIKNEQFKRVVDRNADEITEFIGKAFLYYSTIIKADNSSFYGDEKLSYVYEGNQLYLGGMGPKNEEDQQIGQWYYFNESGRLTTEAYYDEAGERSGSWTWYNEKLKIKEKADYSNGKLEGENTIFYPNGQVSHKAFYKEGDLEGEYLYYNEKGALNQRKQFSGGLLTDTGTFYFEVGEVIPEYLFFYKEGKPQGSGSEFYANGELYNSMSFKEGERHGTERLYHKNGKIYKVYEYIEGSLEGPYKAYYPSGMRAEIGTYLEGELSGPYRTFYPDETLKSEMTYDEGLLDGSYTYYDYDGKKHYNYTYRDGEVIDYRFYDKEGQLIREGKKRGGEFYYKGYSSNGNLSSEGLYDVSGGKTGDWKFYGENGNLSSEGTYDENLAIGAHTFYYADGTVKSVDNYVNDTLTGYNVGYHENGNISGQGGYKNNLRQGEWRFYFANGKVRSINFYHKGEMHGDQKEYSVEGSLFSISNYERNDLMSQSFYNQEGEVYQQVKYHAANNDTTLMHKGFNNNILSETHYLHGIKHGQHKAYYFNGKIDQKGEYLNGMQQGEWMWYYENGKPKYQANYLLGKIDGEYLIYHENGQVDDQRFYQEGESSGTWKSFYEDGSLYVKTDYLNGTVHGRKEFYSPSGKLQLIRFYNYGTLVGYSYLKAEGTEVTMIPIENETAKIKAYYDNGKVSRQYEIENGEGTGSYKTYYYSGQLRDDFNQENGDYQGSRTTYYANGKLKEKKNYLIGLLHGKRTQYYEDGTVKEESNYINGVQTGKAFSYDKTGKKIKSEDYFNGELYASETL